MEFIQNLLRKKDAPKQQDKLEAVRKLEAFQRLKNKFTTGDIVARDGLEKNQLSVGDLVDILDLYLGAVESDTRGKFSTIARIVTGTIPPEQLTSMAEELKKLSNSIITPKDFDRAHPLYSLSVDLGQVTKDGLEELSHYPGGIMVIEQKNQSYKPTGKHTLLLTNRQQMDDGKPIKQIFEEVGLPVVSNIR